MVAVLFQGRLDSASLWVYVRAIWRWTLFGSVFDRIQVRLSVFAARGGDRGVSGGAASTCPCRGLVGDEPSMLG